MPRRKKIKVFVSYSRHDGDLVKPLAELLGVAAEDAVFLDVEQIRPGDLWEDKTLSAVQESAVFVLCWCCVCERSELIAKEIAVALTDANKRLVPVLFCSSAIPTGLARRQWIDLRGQVVHNCPIPHSHDGGVPRPPEAASPVPAPPAMASPPASMQPDPPTAALRECLSAAAPPARPIPAASPMAAPKRRSRAAYVVLGLVLLLMLVSSIYVVRSFRGVPDQRPVTEENPHVAPAPAAATDGLWWIAIFLLATPAIVAVWILLRQRAARWRDVKAASEISSLRSYARPMGKVDYLAGLRGVSSRKLDVALYYAGIAARRQAGSPAGQMLQRRRLADDEIDADVIALRAKSYFESLRS